MTEQRPDTDEREEPGGTPSPGPGELTARPAVPGDDDGAAMVVPGAYVADDQDRARGREREPGN